jgi:hypothetical protein
MIPGGPARQAIEQRSRPPFMTLKRLAMAAATAFVAINIWTGAPLVALWVGSQVSDQAVLSIRAVAAVVMVLAVLVFALSVALTWLNNTYDELIGRPRVERRAPWLRSMRAESEGHISSRVGVTALERIVMVTVYIAVTALIVWLIFLAPGRTGDSEPRPATQLVVRNARLIRSAPGDRPGVSHLQRSPECCSAWLWPPCCSPRSASQLPENVRA